MVNKSDVSMLGAMLGCYKWCSFLF